MRLLLPICAFCLTTLTGFAQSWFNFSNDANSPVYTNALAFGGTRGLMALPQRYYFGLFMAPDGVTDPSLFTFTGLYATNTAIAGHYLGGAGVQVPGWPEGATAMFEVRGWSETLGHDWPAILDQETTGQWAAGGFYGESAIVSATYPGSPAPPVRPTFGSFDLMEVPEPSVGVLAGALVLVCLTRQHFLRAQ